MNLQSPEIATLVYQIVWPPHRRTAISAAACSRIISLMQDLRTANPIPDRLFATSGDPVLLADEMRAAREAANVARWRAWLIADLPAITDEEINARWRWMFPLGGRSRLDPTAPAIGRRAVRAAVDTDPALRQALLRAFRRALATLGLVVRDGALQWRHKPLAWALGAKHDRRVYRMLRSVHNAGLQAQAGMLMRFLEREVKSAEALAWYRHQVAT